MLQLLTRQHLILSTWLHQRVRQLISHLSFSRLRDFWEWQHLQQYFYGLDSETNQRWCWGEVYTFHGYVNRRELDLSVFSCSFPQTFREVDIHDPWNQLWNFHHLALSLLTLLLIPLACNINDVSAVFRFAQQLRTKWFQGSADVWISAGKGGLDPNSQTFSQRPRNEARRMGRLLSDSHVS